MHESIINQLSRFAVKNKIKDGQDKYGDGIKTRYAFNAALNKEIAERKDGG